MKPLLKTKNLFNNRKQLFSLLRTSKIESEAGGGVAGCSYRRDFLSALSFVLPMLGLAIFLSFVLPTDALANSNAAVVYNETLGRYITVEQAEAMAASNAAGLQADSYWTRAVVAVLAYLGAAFLALLMNFLYLSGMLFNYVLEFTVVNLADNITSLKTGMDAAWTVFRDLANMLFIFVLLYISIATILQMGGLETKRLLKNVIIIALLINFSMFFTQVIIDATNSVAVAFHGAALDYAKDQAVSLAPGTNPDNITVAHAFVYASKISSVYDGAEQLKAVAKNNISGLLGLVFVGGLMIVMLSFVLLAGAFFLLVRLVMFIILMVLSPLAFISNILPQTKGLFRSWFSSLTNNALFAPLFMALLWASLKILENAHSVVDTNDSNLASIQGVASPDGVLSGSPDVGAVIFQTLLAIGFMFASLIIAKSLSIQGAGAANRWGKAVLGGATVGVAAGAGRRTMGAGAARIRDSESVKNLASHKNPYLAKVGTWTQGAADRTAKSSFDVRATGATGDSLGKAGGAGGYSAIRDRKVSKERERVGRLETTPAERDRAATNLKEAKKSGDMNARREAQKEYDKVMGVSEADAKARRDKADRSARKVAQYEQNKRAEEVKRSLNARGITSKRLRKQEIDRALMSREEMNAMVERQRQKIESKMRGAGMSTKKVSSRTEDRQNQYINNIKDGAVFNRAYLREELKKKGSNKK